jgi:hypothetical protein
VLRETHRSAAPALLPSTKSVFQSFSSRISARIRARLGPEAGLLLKSFFVFLVEVEEREG